MVAHPKDSNLFGRILFACLILSTPAALLADEPTPVASQRDDVAGVLKFLSDDRGLILGQNVGHGNGVINEGLHDYVVKLEKESGRWPALLGIDYGYDDIPPFLNGSNRILERHAAEGGLVTISMHPKNPWRNSEVGDTDIGTFRDLITPGTRAYKNYRQQLEYVAKGLARLRDNGVVVLWRPLHEMNGGWFWWCANDDGKWTSPEEFKLLWKDMFEYLTEDKKLDNLLWVYSAAVKKGDGEKSATEYYPGDEYVDIVGLDWYMDHLDELDCCQSYSDLAAIGKPMGLTEFGPLSVRNGEFDCDQLMQARKRYPRLRFALFWHSWQDNHVALVDHENGAELMTHPDVITRDEIPPLNRPKAAAVD